MYEEFKTLLLLLSNYDMVNIFLIAYILSLLLFSLNESKILKSKKKI